MLAPEWKLPYAHLTLVWGLESPLLYAKLALSFLLHVESFFQSFGGPKSKMSAISLPPPSIPVGPSQISDPWAGPSAVNPSVLGNLPPNRDIAVLGADIIAETFGDLVKKGQVPSSSAVPSSPLQNKPLVSPQVSKVVTPDELNRPLRPQPEGPPFQPPPPPGFHVNQSPFSWQRSDYARDRRPSYEEERHLGPEFPPPNPYSYRKMENEHHLSQRQDPRLSGGDPRKAARGAPPPGHPLRFPGGPDPHGGGKPPGDGFHHGRGPPPRYCWVTYRPSLFQILSLQI